MRLNYLNHQTFDANGIQQPHLYSLPGVGITLSRRNVLTFLAKLDGHPHLSTASIALDTDAGPLTVIAKVHYGDPTLMLTDLGGARTAIQITLSRHSLTTLLAQLGDVAHPAITFTQAGRATPSQVEDRDMPISIAVEEDALHYAEREVGPGRMHPDTEAALLEAELG